MTVRQSPLRKLEKKAFEDQEQEQLCKNYEHFDMSELLKKNIGRKA